MTNPRSVIIGVFAIALLGSWFPSTAADAGAVLRRALAASHMHDASTPRALVAVDVDGDGIQDLAVAYVDGRKTTLVVHRGDAAAIYSGGDARRFADPLRDGEVIATIPARTTGLRALDIDRDGISDLIARDDAGESYLVRGRRGGDGSGAPEALAVGSRAAAAVAAAEADAAEEATEASRAERLVASGGDASTATVRDADGVTANTACVRPGRDAAPAVAPAPPDDALAAVRMRLNADAVPDLVVIRPGATAPEALLSVATATFTVTSTADTSGDTCGATCTLRQAIRAANLTPDLDAIEFAIPSSDPGFDAATGTYRIRPTSELPEITKPVTLDATTQAGFAGRPIVEIDGSLAGTGNSGLIVSTVDSLVRGFVINNFQASGGSGSTVCGCGIVLNSPFTGFTNNLIVEGNYLGVDVTGTLARANGQSGVFIANGEGQTIGGTTPAARNVISGHPFAGIAITPGEPAHTIAGNFIGTDRSGTLAIPNRTGVLTNSSRSVIGGMVAGARNVISGNTDDGVQISTNGSTAGQNQVIGNYVGTTVDGSFPLPNSSFPGTAGVRVVDATSTRIGIAGAGNVIAGNLHDGVVFKPNDERSAVANKVQGNRIGVDPLGRPLGNGGYGVLLVNQLNADVGGRAAGEANVIAYNALDGIELRAITATCTDCSEPNQYFRNRFFSNLIYENGGIGIDLRNDGITVNPNTTPDGVTANDADADTDFGANGLKNFPVLTSATSTAVDSRVMGTRSFGQLQFFMSPSCDPAGNGEGHILLGEIATGGSGTGQPFDVTFAVPIPAGYVVTAIETEASLDGSSEFSTCLAATGGPAPVVTATPTPGPTATLDGGIPTAGPTTVASATPTPLATRTPAPEVCDDCVDNDFDDALDRADGDCLPPADGGGAGLTGDAGKAALKCQKTLAKAGTTFALARMKSLGACVAKAFACVQQKGGDPGCLTKAGGACAKTEAARQKAADKVGASVAKSCGEPALAAADLTGMAGLGFGAEASGCDDFGVASVDDADDVARCLVARHACRAEALVGTAFPRARQLLALAGRDPTLEASCLPPGGPGGAGADGKGLVKCQKGLAKAGTAYAKARLQARQACAAVVLACLQVKTTDPECLPKAKAKCTKLDAKVEAALAKIAPALAKACGGALAFADVIGAGGVGFGLRVGECSALDVAPLDSVATIAACLGAQHACRVDQLVEGQTPRAAELRGALP